MLLELNITITHDHSCIMYYILIAGEVAAAFAAASQVFTNTDPSYASTLITHAKSLYEFANRFRGKYSDSITGKAAPSPYYTSFVSVVYKM